MGRPCNCCDRSCYRRDQFSTSTTSQIGTWVEEVLSGSPTIYRNTAAGRLEVSGGSVRITSAADNCDDCKSSSPINQTGYAISIGYRAPLTGSASIWVANALGVDFDGETVRVFTCNEIGEPITVLNSTTVDRWEPEAWASSQYFRVCLSWSYLQDEESTLASSKDGVARHVRLLVGRTNDGCDMTEQTEFNSVANKTGDWVAYKTATVSIPDYDYVRRAVGYTIYSQANIEFVDFDCGAGCGSPCSPCGDETFQIPHRINVEFDQDLEVKADYYDTTMTAISGPFTVPYGANLNCLATGWPGASYPGFPYGYEIGSSGCWYQSWPFINKRDNAATNGLAVWAEWSWVEAGYLSLLMAAAVDEMGTGDTYIQWWYRVPLSEVDCNLSFTLQRKPGDPDPDSSLIGQIPTTITVSPL